MLDYEDIPVLGIIDEKGKAPTERLKDVASGRDIYRRMRDDDLVSSANRAEHQGLLDNESPYEESELVEANMSHTTNLNWGGAEQQLERSMAPYYRLVQSPDDLLSVRTLHGEADARSDWNAILSEEISRTIRTAGFFSIQTQLFIQDFVKEGVGVGFFPDSTDWRWRGSGLDKFLFDRQRIVSEEEQEIVCSREDYTAPRLWKMIQGKDTGGWNKKAVVAALQKARVGEADFDDWGKFQDEIRNNDLFTSQIAPPVSVVHLWVQEFDTTWSHYIFPEEDTGVNEFLYKSRGRYKSLSEMMVMYPYGLGTNGKIHGVRGLLFKIYPHEQQRNRSLSRLIDQGILASSLILQAEDETALNTIGLQYLGSTAVLGPEWKVAQITMPDLQRSVMPSIELMERLRNDRVAGYSSENVFDGDQRKTKGEIFAHLEESAELSDSSLDFFYFPFGRMLRQSVRRMTKRNYTPQDPGGSEIAALKNRLLKREVPLEAFYAIDWEATEVVRAIGAGSASAKTLAIERGAELYPRMDDTGRARYDRMKAVDIWGPGVADGFFPRDNKERTTDQHNIAILETAMLLMGKDIPVLPSDRHMVHAREHIKPLGDVLEIAATADEEALAQMAMSVQLLWEHVSIHVAAVEDDPSVQEEAAILRQFLQQVSEPITNGLKAAQRIAEEGGGEEGQEEGPDPEMIKDMEKHQQKLAQAQEEFELKMRNLAKETDFKIAAKDAEAASQIARTRKVVRAQQS